MRSSLDCWRRATAVLQLLDLGLELDHVLVDGESGRGGQGEREDGAGESGAVEGAAVDHMASTSG